MASMRLAFALGGTDFGKSGIGIYVRAVLPRLTRLVRESGGSVVAIGSRREMDAYRGELDGAERTTAPDLGDRPALGALWYLARAGDKARRERADVLLLPAANRRTTARSPVPTVAVVHDLAQLAVRGKYDPLRMAYVRYAVVGALRTADRLVAVSKATADDIAKALGSGSPEVRVVPNGVDHERFRPLAPDDGAVVRARARTGLEGPYLLYASRLEHPGKNHVRLLRAYSESALRRTHTLALAGSDWGGREVIDAEVSRLGLHERVRFLGYVPDELLPGLVAGAEVVIMVGLREGFGLPALEALAAGRAVCVSSTGALPEVVGPLGALCDPLEEQSIKSALERAALDEALRARARDEGPRWAADRGWDKTAAGLLDACRSVVR